jgi:hypothetical protein
MKRVHTDESRARSHAERTNLDLQYSNKEMERALEHKDTLLDQEHQDLAQLKAKNEALQSYASTQALQRQLAQNQAGRIANELVHERAKSPEKQRPGGSGGGYSAVSAAIRPTSPTGSVGTSGRYGAASPLGSSRSYGESYATDGSAMAAAAGMGGGLGGSVGAAGVGGRQVQVRSPRDTLKTLQIKYGVQPAASSVASPAAAAAAGAGANMGYMRTSPRKAFSPSKFQTSPTRVATSGQFTVYSPQIGTGAGGGPGGSADDSAATMVASQTMNTSSRLDQVRRAESSLSANMSPAGQRLQVWPFTLTELPPPPTTTPPTTTTTTTLLSCWHIFYTHPTFHLRPLTHLSPLRYL